MQSKRLGTAVVVGVDVSDVVGVAESVVVGVEESVVDAVVVWLVVGVVAKHSAKWPSSAAYADNAAVSNAALATQVAMSLVSTTYLPALLQLYVPLAGGVMIRVYPSTALFTRPDAAHPPLPSFRTPMVGSPLTGSIARDPLPGRVWPSPSCELHCATRLLSATSSAARGSASPETTK